MHAASRRSRTSRCARGAVVYVICSEADPTTWVAGATFVKNGGSQSFIKLIKSLDAAIPVNTCVVGVSISPDAVVAIALSDDGIHQFVLVDPLENYAPAKCLSLAAVRHKGNEVLRAFGWINPSNHEHSIVVHSKQGNGHERLSVYGHTTNALANKCDTLVETAPNEIHFFAASPFGHAAFITSLSDEKRLLTVLSTNNTEAVFRKSEIKIENKHRTPTALAVGDKLVVIGFAIVGVDTNGWIDVYRVGHPCVHVCSRALPDAAHCAEHLQLQGDGGRKRLWRFRQRIEEHALCIQCKERRELCHLQGRRRASVVGTRHSRDERHCLGLCAQGSLSENRRGVFGDRARVLCRYLNNVVSTVDE